MSISCTARQLYTTTTAARQTLDLPDATLIRSIAAGDKHAMQILFARHNVRVFRFLLRLVGDKSADASDHMSNGVMVFGDSGDFRDTDARDTSVSRCG
jgi:RNA polymerase sigma-70 factor, ECF subfamily